MAPPQESTASFRQSAAVYATEPKRMRLSASARSTTAAGSSTTTRASTGAPTVMTNKGSVYKAQRGRGEGEREQRYRPPPLLSNTITTAAAEEHSIAFMPSSLACVLSTLALLALAEYLEEET